MMDAKMKGMVMAGMMALCLVLGLWATLGDAWLEAEEDDDMEDLTATSGLNNVVYTLSELDGNCDDAKESFEEDDKSDAEYECEDDDTLVVTMSISELCDDGESDLDDAKDAGLEGDALDDMQEDVDEICDTASAGTMGTIGMWAGVVCALVAALILILPMAGVDAMDAIPDVAKMIVSWGAGGFMLLGMLLWYFMLPDGDSSMAIHLWMAGAAMTIGLGSTAIGQFIPENE
tara:strand:- start:341 stop:1036 length:696 start_codon:yes stop_codon:yes gene_type:complete